MKRSILFLHAVRLWLEHFRHIDALEAATYTAMRQVDARGIMPERVYKERVRLSRKLARTRLDRETLERARDRASSIFKREKA